MSKYSIATDAGSEYDENEDTVGCDEALGIWLIADGMGGHAAGEVASRIAKNTFIEHMQAGVDAVQSTLKAHEAIASSAEAQKAEHGMGSTLVALKIAERHAHMVWVGDSRCYLWRQRVLRVITHDHSFVQLMIDKGHLTDETARDHPKRNMVTQVLGLGTPEPDTNSVPLQAGDWLILCSDGLNGELTDAEIAAELDAAEGDVKKVAGYLIRQALARGGRDNVSVVAVEYDGPSAMIAECDEPAEQQMSESAGIIRQVAQWLCSPAFIGIVAAITVFFVFVSLSEGS